MLQKFIEIFKNVYHELAFHHVEFSHGEIESTNEERNICQVFNQLLFGLFLVLLYDMRVV